MKSAMAAPRYCVPNDIGALTLSTPRAIVQPRDRSSVSSTPATISRQRS